MEQIINNALRINVGVEAPIPVPNTGGAPGTTSNLGEVFNNLGVVGTSMLALTILSLIFGATILLLHYRRFHKPASLYTGVGLLAISFGLFFPSLAMTASAINKANLNPDLLTEMNVTATAEGSVATADTTLTLDNDAEQGYTVYAYMDHDNILYGTDHANKIIATGATTTDNPNNLTMNSYGLKALTTNTYQPVGIDEGAALMIYDTDTATPAGTSINLTFAVKVDSITPEDTYTGNVIFRIVPKVPIKDMQDITPEYCQGIPEDQTVTMRDSRDGKLYTVAHLRDGKCWMTENLRLGGETEMTLTPDDTDIDSEFILPESTSNWHEGSSWESPRLYLDRNNADTGKDEVFYSKKAATAGSDEEPPEEVPIDAPYSICPKGWHLPQDDGSFTTTGNNDFYKMLRHYLGDLTDEATEWDDSVNQISLKDPVKLSRPGILFVDCGGNVEIRNTTLAGIWHSSTTINESNRISGLGINPLYEETTGVQVHPAHIHDEGYGSGANIRCITND